jgi:tetratricopeptide (TPR) repeat protein
VAAVAAKRPHWQGPLGVITGVLLIACICWTNRQTRYWKNSRTLFEHTKQLDPDNFRACFNLGQALLDEGNEEAGMANLSEAAKLKPGFVAELEARIGQSFAEQRKMDRALAYYRNALELNPGQSEALNNLAWILATDSDDRIRNGAEAVQLAERACAVTHNQKAMLIGTLAAAYAEAGRFKDAIEAGNRAYSMALASGDKTLAESNQKLLELYRANRPYHQPPTH